MVRLSNVICLLGLVAASAQYDQEGQQRDATCSNTCFFEFFTNKCNADNPACSCTLNDMRENYFCCVAKNCLPHVLPEAIERSSTNCKAYNIPFGPFDAEAVCGIKLPESTTNVPSAPKSTPNSTPAASSSPASGAVVSSTPAPSSTPATSSTIATSSNAAALGPTTGLPGNGTTPAGVNRTTSAGAAAPTNPAEASGPRATLQGVSVVLGLGALIAALL